MCCPTFARAGPRAGPLGARARGSGALCGAHCVVLTLGSSPDYRSRDDHRVGTCLDASLASAIRCERGATSEEHRAAAVDGVLEFVRPALPSNVR